MPFYALPILVPVWVFTRRADWRTANARRLALASGLILALDLDLWHESIALIGAGLGTVIANVQVVFVALAAWRWYGERPTTRTSAIILVVLMGVALMSRFLARHDADGAEPVLGAVLGVMAGVTYAGVPAGVPRVEPEPRADGRSTARYDAGRGRGRASRAPHSIRIFPCGRCGRRISGWCCLR